MKTKHWIWLGMTVLYTYLFYRQSAGINFLIFNIMLLMATFFLQPHLRRQLSFMSVAATCLFTAVNIVWHHTAIALSLNLISLMCLSGLSMKPQTSLMVAWVNSFFAMLASPLRSMFSRVKVAEKEKGGLSAQLTTGRLMSWVVPVVIVSVFFILYVNASPAFEGLISYLPFHVISPGCLFFTALGAYLLFVFFYPVAVKRLTEADVNTPDLLFRKRRQPPVATNPIGLKYEYRTGLILFIMLNLLIFFFNAVDVTFFITGRLPQGVSYAGYVHQGVYTLIASIVLAIVIVLYFFRGNINFLKNNRQLKYATYLWICQNMILILDTAYKNKLYIEEYGLTYKRIGVYVYLLLTLTGLITTCMKVYQVKSNWFLFRKNAWVFYVLLVGFSSFNWTRVITHYNLANLPAGKVDVDYLISLPETNLDILYEAAFQSGHHLSFYQNDRIRDKISSFQIREEQKEWQSWNYAQQQVYQKLKELSMQKEVER